ncbi:MAG: hypothetical protein SFV22_12225 [Saprospiraceae bacterium]|nr:hypothetical protein [Saprospiraceae bacterium]
MKHLFTAFLLVLAHSAIAQVNISCYYREYCKWNAYKETFDRCEGYEESSLFKINKAETMFMHTTESIKSAYYINEKTQNSDTGVWQLNVESDAGNSYIYFLDLDNNEIRVAANIDDELIMIRFYIKRVWTE